ncbi:MAG: hypothetical protein GY714_32040 [Desulfobacterales bacterium]|nr:hypothetical protein [Desulfobacterales bacterium]
MAQYKVNIDNTSSKALEIYTFRVSPSASDVYPDYVKVGEVAASSKETYTPAETFENLYFVNKTDGMPLLNTAIQLFSLTDVTISDDNLKDSQDAFAFCKAYIANPSGKMPSAVNNIISSTPNVTEMETQIDEYLADNGCNFNYATFTAVNFWAQNDTRAWAQESDYTLDVYASDNPSVEPSLITLSTNGEITLKEFNGFETGGGRSYKDAVPLSFSRNMVTSDGATDTSGTSLTGTVIDLTDVDQAGNYGLFLVGTQDGNNIIAQPYKTGFDKTYSLAALCKNHGIDWPDSVPDVVVYDYFFSSSGGETVINGKLDITRVSFDEGVLDNVLDILSSTIYEFTLEVDVGANLGAGTIELKIDAGEIKIPLGDNNYLTLDDSEVMLSINAAFSFVLFKIKTTIPFTLFGGPTFDASVSFTIDNLEAQIGVVLNGDNNALFTLPFESSDKNSQSIQIDNLGLAMGVFFKPPGFDLGVTTKFKIGKDKKHSVTLDDDTLTVVCNIVDDIPDPVYISFYIPKLDLTEIFELLLNLPTTIDIPVSFSDLSVLWVQNPMEPIVLPDGSLSQIAYRLSAYMDLFGLQFYGSLEMNLKSGVHGTVTMSPFSIGGDLFSLTGDGNGVTIKIDSDGNPIKNNYVPKTAKEKKAVENATTKQIIAAGGPEIKVTTSGSPYFTLGARLDFLDFSNSIYAEISKKGIFFDLDFGSIISSKMKCCLKDYQNFTGDFTFGIDMTIPLILSSTLAPSSFSSLIPTSVHSIKLKTDVEATLTITTNNNQIELNAWGTFNFEGESFKIPGYTIKSNISKLYDVIKKIESVIVADAAQIFKDLTGDAETWAKWVEKGIIHGVENVAYDLKVGFKKAAGETASILKKVGYVLNDAAKDMRSAIYSVEHITKGLEKAYKSTGNDISKALHYAGFGPDDIATGMMYAGFNPDEITLGLKYIGYGANEVAKVLKVTCKLGKDAITSAMKYAKFGVNEIEKGLKAIGDVTNDIWKYLNPF